MIREDDDRAVEIRALSKVATRMLQRTVEDIDSAANSLADALIASDMEIPAIRILLVNVSAYCDADELYDGIMPTMPSLNDPGIPAAVRLAAGDVVRRAYAAANMHRPPHGLPS